MATNTYILWVQKYRAVAKLHVYGYIISMEKTNDKLKIARSNQRRKYDNSYNIFNQYIQDNIQKHTEKNMNLLQFLRFKAPGLILDYDNLDSVFFETGDKVRAARTVIALNEVKLNCEFQRPRAKNAKDIAYDFYTSTYKNYFSNKQLYDYGEQDFYAIYRSFCEITLSPLKFEMMMINQKIYDFAKIIYTSFGTELGLEMITQIANDPVLFFANLNASTIEMTKKNDLVKMFQSVFKLNDVLLPLNLLCAFYAYFGHEFLIENHFLYYEFTSLYSNIEDSKFNNCAILVDPSPLFLKKWFRDNSLKDLNLVCIFQNETLRLFFESYKTKKNYSNVEVVSYLQLDDIGSLSDKFLNMDCKAFVFGNHLSDSGLKQIVLRKIQGAFKVNDCFYYDYDTEIEGNLQLKESISELGLSCQELHLFTAGIHDVRDKRKTMLLSCSKDDVDGRMDVIHYTTKKVGEYQSLSPKKYSEKMDQDMLFVSARKIRGVFAKQFKEVYKKQDDNRNSAIKYKFSEEIYFYYTNSLDKQKKTYRPRAYAVMPVFSSDGIKDTESKIMIPGTLKASRQANLDEVLRWLNEEYPYAVFKAKGETIDIQKKLTEIYSDVYKNKSLTLKTFVYLHKDWMETLGENQMSILNVLANSSLGWCLMDNLSSDVVNAEIHNLFEMRKWHQAKAILSYAINKSIEEHHAKMNHIKEEVLEESNRKDRAFTQSREHLTIKFLTAKEVEGIYKKITKDLENPFNLGAYIKLLTGLESNIVCALRWSDFVALEDYNLETEKYSLLIRRQLCNDGSSFGGFARREMYRKVPCCSELTSVLLQEKKKLLRKYKTMDDAVISEMSIVEGEGEQIANRFYNSIAPKELTRYCNTFVKGYRKGYDLTTSIPDSKKGTVETDFMNYGGDIFKANYEHYCVHVANFDRGELDYLLGRLPESPFARNYCDYGNDAAQSILRIKQDRYATIFHKLENKSASVVSRSDEPIRYFSLPSDGLVTEVNLRVSVEEDTTITVNNQHGFDLSADILYRRKK